MNSQKDENGVSTLSGASELDGKTIIQITATPAARALMVSNGTTGTDYGQGAAPIDENSVPVLMAVSSADGKTPVAIYADSNGYLLIKNT